METLGKIRIIHDEPVPETDAGGGRKGPPGGDGRDGDGNAPKLIVRRQHRRLVIPPVDKKPHE